MDRESSSLLRTDVTWDGGTAVVALSGELEAASAPLAAECLREVARAGPERLVLDLGGLVFVDVAGARALDAAQQTGLAGCPAFVRNLPPAVRKVFQVVGLLSGAASSPGQYAAGATGAAPLEALPSRADRAWREASAGWARVQPRRAQRGRAGPVTKQELLSRSGLARPYAETATMPVIEQAKGILIHEQGCTPDQALDALRRASQRSSVPLRTLAERIVRGVRERRNSH